jgi:dihydrofolate reductase
MRKIIVFIATSADGFIARSDGSVDWLDRPRPPGNYGMGEFLDSVDTILWGRKTWGPGAGSGFGSRFKNYVFTTKPPARKHKGVEFVNEPVAAFAKRLRAEPGKNIWMMGGAGIIASFLDAGAIDEFIIHVVPVLIGEGIPLVQARRRTVRLSLRSSHSFPDGVVRLHYQVLGSPRKRKVGR